MLETADVRTMPVSRELDALVAEKVMGWRDLEEAFGERWGCPPDSDDVFGSQKPPRYSTDVTAAWLVFEKFKHLGWDVGWHAFTSGPLERGERREGWFVTDGGEYDFHEIAFGGDSPCLAICRAALLAVLDP